MKNRTFFLKPFCIFLFLSGIIAPLLAQQNTTLTLDSCYKYAEINYPLVKQKGLIEKSTQLTLSNISKGYFPQLSIGGQATYQSDVTQIQLNGTLPPQFNIEFPTIEKDQYKIYGEIVQPLTDIANIRTSQLVTKANQHIEEQKIEVEMHKVRERINQIFFGIKLLDEQLILNDLLQKDIQTGIDKMKKWVDNGIAMKTNVSQLEAELIKVQQYQIEITAARQTYFSILSQFIGIPVDDQINLNFDDPGTNWVPDNQGSQRPEIMLFDYQKQAIGYQNTYLKIKTMPRFSLFLQSGYGRPALNMLNPDFDFYYIGGIRLQWNLAAFYSFNKEKKWIQIQKNTIDIQKELFDFNTNMQLIQQQNEVVKYQKMIENDQKIIKLREIIKENAQFQLNEGTISGTDYLNYINAEERAKQDLILHKMQLIIAIYQYNSILGK